MHKAQDLFNKLTHSKSASDIESLIKDTDLPNTLIRQHPLGFRVVRCDFGQGYSIRIHSWPNMSQQRQVSFEVHDHSFDLTSFVFQGRLMQSVYEAKPDLDGALRLYKVQYASGESRLNATDQRVSLYRTECQEISAGMIYQLKAGVLHKLEPLSTPALTIVLTQDRGSNPVTIGPANAEPALVSPRLPVGETANTPNTIGKFGLETAMFV